MAQTAWLAWCTPSISLETRSLGTGIDAAGPLNINASLGSGNQGEGEAGKPLCWGQPSSASSHQAGPGLSCAQPHLGCASPSPSQGPSGSFTRQVGKPRRGVNQPARVAQAAESPIGMLTSGLCLRGTSHLQGIFPGEAAYLIRAGVLMSTCGSQRCVKGTPECLSPFPACRLALEG